MDKGGVDKLVLELEDELGIVKERLTRGRSNLDVFSIVGMGGIGKTTIATKLYHELEYHFHVRAFCCVSQTYDKLKLLVEILRQVTPIECGTEEMSYNDFGEKIYRSLKGRRYLIVVDDVWDMGAWNELGRFFPDDQNESRILFTSRQHFQVKPDSPPHCLRFLSEKESWELLEKKAFYGGSCPSDLADLGRKIATSCKGLPLAIVVVAGILARTEQGRTQWKEIAESVSSIAQMESSHILELSYKHFPENLKPCFLYFAAFEEDSEIPVRKLIRYWVAEGFVSRVDQKSLEDLAEDYVTELVDRSLVMVSKRRAQGGSKTCHLHDLVRDFCLDKAKQENFMQQIRPFDQRLSTTPFLSLSTSRLSIYYVGNLRNRRVFEPCLRSLLWFGRGGLGLSREFTSSLPYLKNLRVMDLAGFRVDQSFFQIDLPVQLRYLSVSGNIEYIPSFVCNLSNLQTFLVSGYSYRIDVPDSIWKMVTLRHLHINGLSPLRFPSPTGSLENLQTLSHPHLSSESETEELLKALPRLRRLKCSIESKLPHFHVLKQLESLQVHVSGSLVHLDSDSDFPSNLKKLTLSRFRLSGNDISVLVRLPNLEVLQIIHEGFEDQIWDMRDHEQFLKLKILKFRGLGIERWNASSDNFPRLEKLLVHGCEDLERIPESFGEIPTLQLVDVKWCSRSLDSSVKQIQAAQMDLGNEQLKVHIHA